MYDRKDEAREKFLNMHEYTQQKETEISDLETRIEQLSGRITNHTRHRRLYTYCLVYFHI